MPPDWTKGQAAWDKLNFYRQYKRSKPLAVRAFGPFHTKEDARVILDNVSQEFKRKFPVRDRATNRPLGAPKFWQLPPEVRQEAQAYEDNLKKKWASRIAAHPRFANWLHLLTLIHFKNPGVHARAWQAGARHYWIKEQCKKQLMEEAEQNFPAPSIHRLPL